MAAPPIPPNPPNKPTQPNQQTKEQLARKGKPEKPEKPVVEKPLRKEWCVHDTGGQWTILRAWDVYAGEEIWTAAPAMPARLRRWVTDSAAQPVLYDLYRELWGTVEFRRDHKLRPAHLYTRLAGEFAAGRLVLLAPRLVESVPPSQSTAGGGSSAPSAADVFAAAKERQAAIKARDDALQAQKQAAKQKTWIGIRLRDQDGNPVANEHYRVTLPDGTVQEGVTNDKGEATFYEIDPGQCEISFPDIDDKEWQPG